MTKKLISVGSAMFTSPLAGGIAFALFNYIYNTYTLIYGTFINHATENYDKYHFVMNTIITSITFFPIVLLFCVIFSYISFYFIGIPMFLLLNLNNNLKLKNIWISLIIIEYVLLALYAYVITNTINIVDLLKFDTIDFLQLSFYIIVFIITGAINIKTFFYLANKVEKWKAISTKESAFIMKQQCEIKEKLIKEVNHINDK